MHCVKCGGPTKSCDTRQDVKENETFRKRKCLVCGHEFLTVEFAIQENEKSTALWKSLSRGHGRSKVSESE